MVKISLTDSEGTHENVIERELRYQDCSLVWTMDCLKSEYTNIEI